MRGACLALLAVILTGCSGGPGQAEPPSRPAEPTAAAAATASPTLAAQPASATPPPSPAEPSPAATATASPAPASAPADDREQVLRAVREAAPRDALALARAFGLIEGEPAPITLPAPALGERETFWATNVQDNSHFLITATLKVQSPHLLLYLEDGLPYTEEQLQQSAAAFENQAWPALRRLYGDQAEPGRQITVLNARIPGLGGYYSADNELPRELNSYSNQRPMIFINTDSRPPGSDGYVGVLAHEVQHLLHRRVLGHPAIWFNEGGSMLTEHLSGFGDDSLAGSYLIDPDVQLNDWSALSGSPNSHYGAAELFLRYLNDQLPDGLPLGELAGRDAGDDTQTLVDAIQGRHPDIQSFSDLYATWAVANLINDPQLADGRYAYRSLPQTVLPVGALTSDETGLVRQLGADYLEWQPAETQRTIVFSGAATVPVLGAGVPPGAAAGERLWWSGRGDSRISTLTAALRVPEAGASLRFNAWYDIEQDYDYAYLTLSEDGGATWRPLAIPASAAENPLGLNLGQGITGQSGGWREQQADLSQWAGKEISLRFWQVNDEAYNTPGLALAGLRIDGGAALEWRGAGFVEIANRLPQEWELRGVVFAPGQPPSVADIAVDAGAARWTIPPGARAVLVVSGATAASTEPARYAYRTE